MADPCKTCGSPVRIEHVRGEMSAADTTPPIEEVRVCTNVDCATNGEHSLTEVV